jgi:hypothetical protein
MKQTSVERIGGYQIGGRTMRSLSEDTIADKVLRFIIGMFLGGVASWSLALQFPFADTRTFLLVSAALTLLTGLAAVVFGNRFLEKLIARGW